MFVLFDSLLCSVTDHPSISDFLQNSCYSAAQGRSAKYITITPHYLFKLDWINDSKDHC